MPVEIDARVVRLAVDFAAGDAVSECVHAGDVLVGHQIAQLRGLLEARAAAVVRGAGRQLVAESGL